MPASEDVVVVGGGVIGVSVAYWLARMGAGVLLLEAARLCTGATGRNAGLLVWGASELEQPALVEGVLSEEGIDADYEQPGHLALASSEAVWRSVRQEASRGRSGPSSVVALDRDACERLLGRRVRQGILGGRLMPRGGLVNPVRLTRGLAAAASRRGARIAERTAVTGVRKQGPRLVLDTTRGTVRCNTLVLACSAGIRRLLPGFDAVVQPVRGQMLATDRLPPVFPLGMALDVGTLYWRQTRTGHVLLGGYRHLDPDGERGDGEQVNPAIQGALDGALPELLPGLAKPPVRHRWSGVMDVTTDGRPVVGPLTDDGSCWVAIGFGGHGLPPSLGAGREVATALSRGGGVPGSLRSYVPARFPALDGAIRSESIAFGYA